MPSFLKSAILAAAACALAFGAAAPAAVAGSYPSQITIAASANPQPYKLGLNRSIVIELPRDARDVLVSNPQIAEAVIRTPRRIYLTGVAVGQASLFVFDAAGNLFANLQLEVERDIGGLEGTLNRLLPGADIQVELINDNIILSGTVRNANDARRAVDLADAFANGGANSQAQQDRGSGGNSASAGDGGTSIVIGTDDSESERTSSVVNMLAIEGEDQVNVRVTVAEVQRNIIKQLGIDLSPSLGAGNWTAMGVGENTYGIAGKLLTNSLIGGTFNDGTNSITTQMNALEQEGLMRILAEPTLTAISGESASFLAGGEFPVPTGRDSEGYTIEFKPYGVALSFTPVVLSEGRISLRIKTEVSEMSQDGAFQLEGGGRSSGTLSIPSIRVRRAETTLELPSGGSIAMAGMLQDNVRQSITGFPGLKELPVLGTLFRSRDYQRQETELVIIVTPYLVKPVGRAELAQPDDGFNTPSDSAAIFLGRLNRVYRTQGEPVPPGAYQGGVGFIFD